MILRLRDCIYLIFRALLVLFFSFLSPKRSKKACCHNAPCSSLELRNSIEQLPEISLATRLIADFCLSSDPAIRFQTLESKAKKGAHPHSLPTMSRFALRGADMATSCDYQVTQFVKMFGRPACILFDGGVYTGEPFCLLFGRLQKVRKHIFGVTCSGKYKSILLTENSTCLINSNSF